MNELCPPLKYRRGISLTDAHPITTEAEYDAALARVSELMNALNGPHGQIEDPNHPARVELDALVDLIEMYENEHYPIEQRDAVAAS